MRITGWDARRIGHFVKQVYRGASEDDIVTYAAALAFHAMLAVFPFLLFMIALISFLHLPDLLGRLMAWSRMVLPPQGMQKVAQVVESLRTGRETGLLSFGVAAAIWAASGGIRSAMNVLNRAYNVEEGRQAWRRYLISIVYTIAFGLIILSALTFMFLGPHSAQWITDFFNLDPFLIVLWSWLRFPLLLALLVLLAALAYSFLPYGVRFKWFSPGAGVAIGLWLVASLGFRFYVSNFGRYDVIYGSVGALIVLLFYFYLSALALLIGGEVNATLFANRKLKSANRVAP